jgi:CDP-glucose 4,6-dehydratase
VGAVVIVTSDKCYQNLEIGRAFRETDAMGGRDPGASKAAELSPRPTRELRDGGRWHPCAQERHRGGDPPTGSSRLVQA